MSLKTCHFAACFTILWTSISVFYVNTARDIVTVLLIFAQYLSLYLHIFTKHTEAHTHKHTCTISTQEEWSQPGTGAWLREAGKGFVRDIAHTHKKKSEKTRYSRIHKKRFEHIELQAKLLDYFLRSNKSNINQTRRDDTNGAWKSTTSGADERSKGMDYRSYRNL